MDLFTRLIRGNPNGILPTTRADMGMEMQALDVQTHRRDRELSPQEQTTLLYRSYFPAVAVPDTEIGTNALLLGGLWRIWEQRVRDLDVILNELRTLCNFPQCVQPNEAAARERMAQLWSHYMILYESFMTITDRSNKTYFYICEKTETSANPNDLEGYLTQPASVQPEVVGSTEKEVYKHVYGQFFNTQ